MNNTHNRGARHFLVQGIIVLTLVELLLGVYVAYVGVLISNFPTIVLACLAIRIYFIESIKLVQDWIKRN